MASLLTMTSQPALARQGTRPGEGPRNQSSSFDTPNPVVGAWC